MTRSEISASPRCLERYRALFDYRRPITLLTIIISPNRHRDTVYTYPPCERVFVYVYVCGNVDNVLILDLRKFYVGYTRALPVLLLPISLHARERAYVISPCRKSRSAPSLPNDNVSTSRRNSYLWAIKNLLGRRIAAICGAISA